MSNFVRPKIALGTITEQTYHEVEFEKIDGSNPIKDITVSCGCTTPINLFDRIKVGFNAPRIPDDLRKEDAGMEFTKYLTIQYVDGIPDERLEISGVIVK